MSQPKHSLDQIQRWMFHAIVHPAGVNAGIESPESQSQIPVTPQTVEAVVSRSKALTSIERLNIYSNAYLARLTECLQAEYPALVHALGKELFDQFAIGYLQKYPSTSYTLSDLGKDFPKYLQETRPDSETSDAQIDWPDFLIDLAILERNYCEIFDGPGSENQAILQPDDFVTLSPNAWANSRLISVPCLRVLQLRFPVHEYASAVRRGEEPPVPNADPTFLAVTRRQYVVRRETLSKTQFQLLNEIINGSTIGAAIKSVAGQTEMGLDHLAQSLRHWFRIWCQAGYFQSIEPI